MKCSCWFFLPQELWVDLLFILHKRNPGNKSWIDEGRCLHCELFCLFWNLTLVYKELRIQWFHVNLSKLIWLKVQTTGKWNLKSHEKQYEKRFTWAASFVRPDSGSGPVQIATLWTATP